MDKAKFSIRSIQKIPERESLGGSKTRTMSELDLNREAAIALDHYRGLYEARYGSKPVFRSVAEATTSMKDIIRKVHPEGLQRVLAMTKQYLEMENEYYKQRFHALEVFLRDIQSVSAATKSNTIKSPQIVALGVQSLCPKCNVWFTLVCKSSEIEQKVFLTDCDKCNTN